MAEKNFETKLPLADGGQGSNTMGCVVSWNLSLTDQDTGKPYAPSVYNRGSVIFDFSDASGAADVFLEGRANGGAWATLESPTTGKPIVAGGNSFFDVPIWIEEIRPSVVQGAGLGGGGSCKVALTLTK